MNSRLYTVGILALLLPAFLTGGEVSENTQSTPFSVLLDHFQEVKTNIETAGTVRLTGHLAENLNSQVIAAVEQSRVDSASEEKVAAALLSPSRGPAIISADGIVSGEVASIEYPSYGVPNDSTKLGDELSLKPSPVNVGNLGSVASAMSVFDNGVGRLPIPYNVASNAIAKGSGEKFKSADLDKAGSPYEDLKSGTTFGKNPSDDSSFSNLVQSKKKSGALKDSLEKELAELEGLKDKDKEKEEKEKKKVELNEKISKIKDLETPFDMDDYLSVRDLFNNEKDQISEMLEKDPSFQEKAAEIFGFVPANASKSFGDLDSDRNRKKNYAEFASDFKEKGASKFPAKPAEDSKAIRTERAH